MSLLGHGTGGVTSRGSDVAVAIMQTVQWPQALGYNNQHFSIKTMTISSRNYAPGIYETAPEITM